MSAPATTPYLESVVELRDAKLRTRVLSAGNGEAVMFLHGTTGLAWTPFLDALAGRFRVLAPEHPGSGQSVGLEELRDVWDLVLYYNDLLDALGVDRIMLVGHSFGGMVAAELAANNPERVSKLVLIAPLGLWRDDAPIPDLAGLPAPALAERMVADPQSPLAADLVPAPTDAQAQFERSLTMASVLHFTWPIPDKGLSRRIHRVKAPTLLVWGRQDRLVPPVYADEFSSRLRDAQVTLVDGAAHLPHLEQPDVVRDAVLTFLAT